VANFIYSGKQDSTIFITNDSDTYSLDGSLELNVETTSAVYLDETASDNEVIVYGSVKTGGAANTIVIGGENNSIAIHEGGSVKSNFAAANLDGDGNSIQNSGNVTGLYGVYLYGTNMSLDNSGTIKGKEAGVCGHDIGTDTFVLHNSGKIIGATFAIELGDGDDQIVNDGEIKGAVHLGGGNNSFDFGHGDVFGKVIGGTGIDSYTIHHKSDKIVEKIGGGTDFVHSSISYTLGDNLESLDLSGSKNLKGTGNGLSNYIGGNAGDNVLSGLGGADHLRGAAGDDVLFGDAGADVFIFTPAFNGRDTIMDFDIKGAVHDHLDLSGVASNASDFDLDSHLTQHGHDAVLTIEGSGAVVFKDVDMDDLTSDFFTFNDA
jgi:Ca2+-binding RTX toxin-like protein